MERNGDTMAVKLDHSERRTWVDLNATRTVVGGKSRLNSEISRVLDIGFPFIEYFIHLATVMPQSFRMEQVLLHVA